MAKPRRPKGNRPDRPKAPGGGGIEIGEEEVEAEVRGGGKGDEPVDPPTQKEGTNVGAPLGHIDRGVDGGGGG